MTKTVFLVIATMAVVAKSDTCTNANPNTQKITLHSGVEACVPTFGVKKGTIECDKNICPCDLADCTLTTGQDVNFEKCIAKSADPLNGKTQFKSDTMLDTLDATPPSMTWYCGFESRCTKQIAEAGGCGSGAECSNCVADENADNSCRCVKTSDSTKFSAGTLKPNVFSGKTAFTCAADEVQCDDKVKTSGCNAGVTSACLASDTLKHAKQWANLENHATVSSAYNAPDCADNPTVDCWGVFASNARIVGNMQNPGYIQGHSQGLTAHSGICYKITGPSGTGGTAYVALTDRCAGYCRAADPVLKGLDTNTKAEADLNGEELGLLTVQECSQVNDGNKIDSNNVKNAPKHTCTHLTSPCSETAEQLAFPAGYSPLSAADTDKWINTWFNNDTTVSDPECKDDARKCSGNPSNACPSGSVGHGADCAANTHRYCDWCASQAKLNLDVDYETMGRVCGTSGRDDGHCEITSMEPFECGVQLAPGVQTGDNCPTTPITSKSEPAALGGQKRFCYFSNWAQFRTKGNEGKYPTSKGKMFVGDLDATLCDVIIWAFFDIAWPNHRHQGGTSSLTDPRGYTITKQRDQKEANKGHPILREWNDNTQIPKGIKKWRAENPDVLVIASIGGWNTANNGFRYVVEGTEAQQTDYLDRFEALLEEYEFDGIDYDWEHPGTVNKDDNYDLRQGMLESDPPMEPCGTTGNIGSYAPVEATYRSQERENYRFHIKMVRDRLNYMADENNKYCGGRDKYTDKDVVPSLDGCDDASAKTFGDRTVAQIRADRKIRLNNQNIKSLGGTVRLFFGMAVHSIYTDLFPVQTDNQNCPGMDTMLDHLGLMTYDLAGAWDNFNAGHNVLCPVTPDMTFFNSQPAAQWGQHLTQFGIFDGLYPEAEGLKRYLTMSLESSAYRWAAAMCGWDANAQTPGCQGSLTLTEAKKKISPGVAAYSRHQKAMPLDITKTECLDITPLGRTRWLETSDHPDGRCYTFEQGAQGIAGGQCEGPMGGANGIEFATGFLDTQDSEFGRFYGTRDTWRHVNATDQQVDMTGTPGYELSCHEMKQHMSFPDEQNNTRCCADGDLSYVASLFPCETKGTDKTEIYIGGFEDECSMKEKGRWIKDNGFGGAIIWAVDQDVWYDGQLTLTRALSRGFAATQALTNEEIAQCKNADSVAGKRLVEGADCQPCDQEECTHNNPAGGWSCRFAKAGQGTTSRTMKMEWLKRLRCSTGDGPAKDYRDWLALPDQFGGSLTNIFDAYCSPPYEDSKAPLCNRGVAHYQDFADMLNKTGLCELETPIAPAGNQGVDTQLQIDDLEFHAQTDPATGLYPYPTCAFAQVSTGMCYADELAGLDCCQGGARPAELSQQCSYEECFNPTLSAANNPFVNNCETTEQSATYTEQTGLGGSVSVAASSSACVCKDSRGPEAGQCQPVDSTTGGCLDNYVPCTGTGARIPVAPDSFTCGNGDATFFYKICDAHVGKTGVTNDICTNVLSQGLHTPHSCEDSTNPCGIHVTDRYCNMVADAQTGLCSHRGSGVALCPAKTCNAGSELDAPGASDAERPYVQQCYHCMPGRFNDGSANTCSLCPAGKFTTKAAQASCEGQCPLGSISNPERTGCTRCPPNHLANNDHSACVECDVIIEADGASWDVKNHQVLVGDRLCWKWSGTMPHNVKIDDPDSASEEFRSHPAPYVEVGSYSHVFASPGTFVYRCEQHPTNMEGVITVDCPLPLVQDGSQCVAAPETHTCTGASAGLTAAECNAWQAGYDAMHTTGGPEWRICEGHRNTPCGCPPVTHPQKVNCETVGGQLHITKIILNLNSFSGTLPPEWSAMTELTELNLNSNPGLTGGLPPEWSALTKLTEISLRDIGLTGTLPPEWSALTQVTSMHLNDNALSGTLPPEWSALTQMLHMNLNNNQLTGAPPEQWSTMNTTLLTLYLHNNELSGAIPHYFPGLSAGIACDANSQTGDGLTCDRANSFSHCGIGCTYACTCANGTPATDCAAATDVKCASCNSGYSNSTCQLTLCNGTSTNLNQADCTAWQIGFDALGGGSWTKCSGNKFDPCACQEKTTPQYVDCVGDRLFSIKLQSNALSGTLPPAWGTLDALAILKLGSNAITGSIPTEWAGSALPALRIVELEMNHLTGPIPSGLAWPAFTTANATHVCQFYQPDYNDNNDFTCPLVNSNEVLYCKVPGHWYVDNGAKKQANEANECFAVTECSHVSVKQLAQPTPTSDRTCQCETGYHTYNASSNTCTPDAPATCDSHTCETANTTLIADAASTEGADDATCCECNGATHHDESGTCMEHKTCAGDSFVEQDTGPSSSNDRTCRCKSGHWNATSNPASCEEHTLFTTLGCHGLGKPNVAGSRTTDNACGTQCDTGTMIDTNDNTCVAHTAFSALDCHGSGKPNVPGSSTQDNSCGDECDTGTMIDTNDNRCVVHTSFTDPSLDCHAKGKPTVSGDSTTDNSCGSECGTGTMIETSAGATFNTCISHTSFTELNCHASGQPNEAGNSATDNSCGTACNPEATPAQYLNSGLNQCVDARSCEDDSVVEASELTNVNNRVCECAAGYNLLAQGGTFCNPCSTTAGSETFKTIAGSGSCQAATECNDTSVQENAPPTTTSDRTCKCATGYHTYNASSNTCATNQCTCANGGKAATGPNCPNNGDAKCTSCVGAGDFYLNNSACVAWTVCGANQTQTVPPTSTNDRGCGTIQDCQVSSFGDWSACSQTCGSGTWTRTRSVTIQAGEGGAACPNLSQTISCNIAACPVDCVTTSWGTFNTCTKSCGGGVQTRSRTVTTAAQDGGVACPSLEESKICGTQDCPIHCALTTWSSYSSCSKSCGAGTRTRTRNITTHPEHGGTTCGLLSEDEPCTVQDCSLCIGQSANLTGSECNAWIAGFETTGGIHWSKCNTDADTDRLDPCSCGHVTCNSEGTLITEIELRNANLTGPIPSGWSDFASLQNLVLGDNQLTGALPAGWSVLQKLTNLELDNNQLSGPLPADWHQLNSLQELDLYNNELTGSLPPDWSTMQNVTEIDVHDNLLSGPLPAEWVYLPSIKDLHLHGNGFNGSIPQSWSNFSSRDVWDEINLSDNKLTGTIPPGFGFANANSCKLQNNSLNIVCGEYQGTCKTDTCAPTTTTTTTTPTTTSTTTTTTPTTTSTTTTTTPTTTSTTTTTTTTPPPTPVPTPPPTPVLTLAPTPATTTPAPLSPDLDPVEGEEAGEESTSEQSTDETSSSTDWGLIIGCIVGGLLLLGGGYYVYRQRQKNAAKKAQSVARGALDKAAQQSLGLVPSRNPVANVGEVRISL